MAETGDTYYDGELSDTITVDVFLVAGPTHSSLSDGVQIGDALVTSGNPDGTFTYIIPNDTPADNYRIKIVSGGISSSSDGFNIYTDTALNNIHNYDTDKTDIDIKIHDNVLRFPMGTNNPPGWYGYIDRKFPTYRNYADTAYVEHTFKGYYFDENAVPKLPAGFSYNGTGTGTDSGANPGIENNHTYKWKIATVYDNNQESALDEGGITKDSHTYARQSYPLKFRYNKDNWNPRITGFNIYRATDYVQNDKNNTYYLVGSILLNDPDIGVDKELKIVTNRCFVATNSSGSQVNALSTELEATDGTGTRKAGVIFLKDPPSSTLEIYDDGNTTWKQMKNQNKAGDRFRFSQAGITFTNTESASPSNVTDFGDRNYIDAENVHPWVFGRGTSSIDSIDLHPCALAKKAPSTFTTTEDDDGDTETTETTKGGYPDLVKYNERDPEFQTPDNSFPVVHIPDHNASNGNSAVYTHYVVNREGPNSDHNVYYLLDNKNLINWGACWLSGGYRNDTAQTGSPTGMQKTAVSNTTTYTINNVWGEAQGWYTANGWDDSYGEIHPGAIVVQRNPYTRMQYDRTYIYHQYIEHEPDTMYYYTVCMGWMKDGGGGRSHRFRLRDNDVIYAENEGGFHEGLRNYTGVFTTGSGTRSGKNLRLEFNWKSTSGGSTENRVVVTQCAILKVLNGTGTGTMGQVIGGKGSLGIDDSWDADAFVSYSNMAGRTVHFLGNSYVVSSNVDTLLKFGTNTDLPSTGEVVNPAQHEMVLRPRSFFTEQDDGSIEVQYIDAGTFVGHQHYLGVTNLDTYYKYSKFIEGRNYVGNVQIFSSDDEDAETHKNWVMFSELGKPDVIPATNFIQLDDLQGGEIVGLERLYGDLCVLMTKGIYRLSLNSIDPTGWRLKETEPNIGCIADGSVISYENKIFFAGPEAFYMLDTNFNAIPLTKAINSDYQAYKGSDIKCSIDILQQELHMRLPGKKYHTYILNLDMLNQNQAHWRVHKYSTSEETATYAVDENYKLMIVRHKNTTNFTNYTLKCTDTDDTPYINNNINTHTADTGVSIVAQGSTGKIEIAGVNLTSTWAGLQDVQVEGLSDGTTTNNGNYNIVSLSYDSGNTKTIITTNGSLENETQLTSFTDASCAITSGSSTVTCTSSSSIEVGQTVSGSGVDAGTTVISVDTAGAVTSFELSTSATATTNPVTLTFSKPVTLTGSGPYTLNFPNNNNPLPSTLPSTHLTISSDGSPAVGAYDNEKIIVNNSSLIQFESTNGQAPNQQANSTWLVDQTEISDSNPVNLTFTIHPGDEPIIDSKDTFMYSLNPVAGTEPVSFRRKTGFIKLSDDLTKGVTVRRIYMQYKSSENFALRLINKVAVGSTTYDSDTGYTSHKTIPASGGELETIVLRPKIPNLIAIQVDIEAFESPNPFEIRKFVIEVD